MSAVDSGRDTSSADLLAEIMQQILTNKAGKTADNSFTLTQIIPLGDGIDIADTVTGTALGLWFEITNDAGGGTTTAAVAGKIGQSYLTEYPTVTGEITDDNGDGWKTGQGLIGTTELAG